MLLKVWNHRFRFATLKLIRKGTCTKSVRISFIVKLTSNNLQKRLLKTLSNILGISFPRKYLKTLFHFIFEQQKFLLTTQMVMLKPGQYATKKIFSANGIQIVLNHCPIQGAVKINHRWRCEKKEAFQSKALPSKAAKPEL